MPGLIPSPPGPASASCCWGAPPTPALASRCTSRCSHLTQHIHHPSLDLVHRAQAMHAVAAALPQAVQPEDGLESLGLGNSLRCFHGGPAPFGVGMSLLQAHPGPLASQAPQPGDPQRQVAASLRKLARGFHKPVDHLTWEQQAFVQEQRLRMTLSKFWGLMHESDRPWHRPTIIRLCLLLPSSHTRRLYRRLKPASMQHTLAQRAKVEKVLQDLHEEAWMMQRRTAQLVRKKGQTRPLPLSSPSELQELLSQARRLQSQLGTAQAQLSEVRRLAWQSFQDQDYCTHCDTHLQPLVTQLTDWCARYVKGVRGLSTGRTRPPRVRPATAGQSSSSRPNPWNRVQPSSSTSAAAAAGQDLAWLRMIPLPAFSRARWRYPPAWDGVMARWDVGGGVRLGVEGGTEGVAPARLQGLAVEGQSPGLHGGDASGGGEWHPRSTSGDTSSSEWPAGPDNDGGGVSSGGDWFTDLDVIDLDSDGSDLDDDDGYGYGGGNGGGNGDGYGGGNDDDDTESDLDESWEDLY